MNFYFTDNIGPSSGGAAKKGGSYGTGKETLRLRSKGPATVEVVSIKIMYIRATAFFKMVMSHARSRTIS